MNILRKSYWWAHICFKYHLRKGWCRTDSHCFAGCGEFVTGSNCVTFEFMSQQWFQAHQTIWIVLFLCCKHMLSIHHHMGTYRSMTLELVENLLDVNISQWRADTHVCYHRHKSCLYVWYCWRRRISALAPLLHGHRYTFRNPHRYIGTTVHHTLWRYLNW